MVCATLSIHIGTLRSAAAMLREALHNVMRGPMSFFDTVPVGRILNRFSADIDTMDNRLPMSLLQWLSCSLRVSYTPALGLYYCTRNITYSLSFGVSVTCLLLRNSRVAILGQFSKHLESITKLLNRRNILLLTIVTIMNIYI